MSNFRPIKGDYWSHEPDVRALDHDDQTEITNLLLGRKVTKVADDHLLLDDGTVIKAIGHEGGCACASGCYDLSALNGVDNIITRVEFDYHPGGDHEPWDGPNEAKKCDPAQEDWTGHYRIFVYADNQRVNLMRFDGTDGNGYYGTGFELLVRLADGA